MANRIKSLLAGLAIGLAQAGGALGGPVTFDLPLNVPPVITDSQAPQGCVVTFLIEDVANGDLFAQRIRIPAAETDQPVNNRLPCPTGILPRLGAWAREVCNSRAVDPKTCVYADMGRGFERQPDITNTAENTSRCRSDMASHIAAACWMSNNMPVCNVACGESPAEAISRARVRCEDKQQQSCPITATVPVTDQAPSSPVAPVMAATAK
jgi:hypothetical protein